MGTVGDAYNNAMAESHSGAGSAQSTVGRTIGVARAAINRRMRTVRPRLGITPALVHATLSSVLGGSAGWASTGPSPTGTYDEPTVAQRSEKEHFGSSRRARWFGL
jgi:hypothetical protein